MVVEKTERILQHKERTFGSFLRTTEFDVQVDNDNASTEIKNGVFNIKVPKAVKEIKITKRL